MCYLQNVYSVIIAMSLITECVHVSMCCPQNGFDYILTYYDNPKGHFPSIAYNWMASTGQCTQL